MDAIWSYFERSPMLIIALVLVVAYLFTRLSSGNSSEARPEDLVPHYKRFDRREPELGDRRKQKPPADLAEDQRKGPRRS